jgi:hypothetical protein
LPDFYRPHVINPVFSFSAIFSDEFSNNESFAFIHYGIKKAAINEILSQFKISKYFISQMRTPI